MQSTYIFIIQLFFHLTYSFPYCIFPHLKVSSSLEYHKLVSLIELHNQRRPVHKLTNSLSFRLNVEYKITLVLPYLSLCDLGTRANFSTNHMSHNPDAPLLLRFKQCACLHFEVSSPDYEVNLYPIITIILVSQHSD